MNKYEELKASLAAENKGKHYLKQREPSECVESLCAEIDQLRAQLAAAQAERDGLRKDVAALNQWQLEAVREADGLREMEKDRAIERKELKEIKECAEAIVRNMREDIEPALRDNVWVATAACHAVVILQDIAAMDAAQREAKELPPASS